MQSSVESARKRLRSLGDSAVECLAEAIAEGDWRAAAAILDRIGLHSKQTVEHVQEDLTEATLDELRAKAAAIMEQLKDAKGGLDS